MYNLKNTLNIKKREGQNYGPFTQIKCEIYQEMSQFYFEYLNERKNLKAK